MALVLALSSKLQQLPWVVEESLKLVRERPADAVLVAAGAGAALYLVSCFVPTAAQNKAQVVNG